MNKLFNEVSDLLGQAYQASFSQSPPGWIEETLAYPDQSMGDIASSMSMRLASELHMAPMEVAGKLASNISVVDDGLVESADVVAPGFINLRLRPSALSSLLESSASLIADIGRQGHGQTVVMDYSHPNMGKPMGVHHLLSTIIGDAIKRSLRAGGYEVVADSFIGDLGTQFGKLIWAVKQWGDLGDIESDPITELQKLYVRFHIEADSDVALDDAGREEFQKLESGDSENRALWAKIVSWSKAEIQPIYDQLGVEFDHMNGESFYEDKMQPILDDGVSKGLFVESQGALVCKLDDPDSPPAILRKSDGATLYLTRDLARIKYWEDTWKPDYMIVVVDVAQKFAQQQLYEVARKLKLTDARLTQVNFGRMRFSDGSMSTRKGNILLLKDLISESVERARKLTEEKSERLSEPERAELARILAISSIKYNILMQNRHSDITFNWETMLNFDGNSAPYLLYTIVRLRSLLSKAESRHEAGGSVDLLKDVSWNTPIERAIILLIGNYGDQFERSITEFRPNIIANYLYELAQAYNNLYNNLDILSADEVDRSGRIAISRAVGAVMTHGFASLGLEIPHKM